MSWVQREHGHNYGEIFTYDSLESGFPASATVSNNVSTPQDLAGTLLVLPSAGAPPRFVQGASDCTANNYNLATFTASLPSNGTAGNTFVVDFLLTTLANNVQIGIAFSSAFGFTFWQPSTTYAVGETITDTFGNVQEVTHITGGGLSAAVTSPPGWNQTTGGTTGDNQVTWTNQGPGGQIVMKLIAGSGDYIMSVMAPILSSGPCSITLTMTASQSGVDKFWTTITSALHEYSSAFAGASAFAQAGLVGSTIGSVTLSPVGSERPGSLAHLAAMVLPYLAPPAPPLTVTGGGGPIPEGWYIVYEQASGSPATGGGYTDRSAYLYIGEGQRHEGNLQARQRGNWTYTLIAADDDDCAPTLFTPVFFYDENPSGFALVFSGIIQDFKARQIGLDGWRYFDVTAVSFEAIFDTVLVTEPFAVENATCGSIVTSLFNLFEPGAQVSLGTIQAGVMLPLFNANVGDKLSELFTQLATTSEFTWNVNPSTLQLFFGAPSAVSAPFPLTSPVTMWDSISTGIDGSNCRNRQLVKLSYDAFSHSMEYFPGTGQTSFTLQRPVNQVVAAYVTLSTCNTATASFSGLPSPGDTFTIGPASGVWQAGHIYGAGGAIVVNGFVQVVTFAGTSGGSEPAFSTITGATTVDNSVIWTCQGPLGIATGSDTYTWVAAAALDNTQFGQIVIQPTTAQCASAAAQAINATAANRGVNFSLPTWENSLCNAGASGSTLTIQQKAAGSGFVSSLSTTGSGAMTFSAPQTSGGTSPQGSVGPNEGATISIQVYQEGTSTAAPAIAYTEGSNIITSASPLNSGTNLNVEYTRQDGDVIQCENTPLVDALAVVTAGTGKLQAMSDQSSLGLIATNALAGLQLAQQALASFEAAPSDVDIQTLQPGIFPGMAVTLALSGFWGALLNSTAWYCEEVRVEYIPGINAHSPWVDQTQAPGGGHYRYTYHLINAGQINSYMDWWLNGGSTGGGASGGPLAATSGGALATQGTGLTSGGVNEKTASYLAVVGDYGKLIVMNSSSATTLTLPSTPPFATWTVDVQIIGTGGGSVSPNGLNLDGASSSLTLLAGQGCTIFTDGTNYFTERGRMPLATTTVPGLVEPDGTVITVSGAGAITVPAATSAALGVVKPDGTIITVAAGAITVAKASASAFGVVKVDNTTITASGGVISAIAGGSGLAPSASTVVGTYAGNNYGPLFELTAPPSHSSLTALNTTGATASDANGGLLVTSSGGIFALYVKAVPSTPYTFTVAYLASVGTVAFSNFGIAIRDSSSGKIVTFGTSVTSTPTNPCWGYNVQEWSGYSTFVSNALANALLPPGSLLFLRVTDNGTNFIFQVSVDGFNFSPVLTVSRTAYLANVSQIGILAGQGFAGSMLVVHWSGV